MAIITFSHPGSKEAILNGTKTSTLRDWKERHAKQFHKGDIVTAYDKNPLLKGKPFALIKVTRDPYEFRLKELDQNRLRKEGHPEMTVLEFAETYFPEISIRKPLTCLEFEFVSVINNE